MSDIVVIAYRRSNSVLLEMASSGIGAVTANQPRAGDSFGTPADAEQPVAGVNVEVTNPANRDAVIAAAQRLAEAIVQTLGMLGSLDPNKVISVPDAGTSATVAQIIADINNTKFTVTDRTDFQNNGVGSAVRGATFNTETINFNAINGPNGTGYGASTYNNNAGLVGIILHEMGHISLGGDALYRSSIQYQRRDPTTKYISNFYNTVYAQNLEAFANDFMNAAAKAMNNFDLQGMLPGGRSGSVDAVSIYNSHVPPSQQE